MYEISSISYETISRISLSEYVKNNCVKFMPRQKSGILPNDCIKM